MARHESAEWVRFAFDTENVPIAELELDYFSRDQALAYLDLKLDALFRKNERTLAHRQHRESFQTSRDTVLSRLGEAAGYPTLDQAWTSANGRRLLGYSPVLEGLATYLHVPDFRNLDVGHLTTLTDTFPEWTLLSNLMLRLLEREHDKFLNNWLDDISRAMFTAEQLNNLYDVREQCSRLAVRSFKHSTTTDFDEQVPDSLVDSYRAAIESQLSNHPLLATNDQFVNSTFRDYVAAFVLVNGSHDEQRAVARVLRGGSDLPSPGLAPFMLSLLEDRALSTELLDLALASLGAREEARAQYSFSLRSLRSDGLLTIELDSSMGEAPAVMTVPTHSPGTVLLPARIKRLDLTTDDEVRIEGRSLRIGPDVQIDAMFVTLKGAECAIEAHRGLSIRGQIVTADWDQQVRISGQGLLIEAVESEGWVQRFSREPSLSEDRADVQEYYHALRRLLRFFRRTQHVAAGTLAADKEQIWRFVLRTDDKADAIMKTLTDDGYVRYHGPEYRLSQDFLASLALSFEDIGRAIVTPELSRFLHRVAQQAAAPESP